ncbi:hypothetical protein JCM8208_001477 [Rhodotorula glutinis]
MSPLERAHRQDDFRPTSSSSSSSAYFAQARTFLDRTIYGHRSRPVLYTLPHGIERQLSSSPSSLAARQPRTVLLARPGPKPQTVLDELQQAVCALIAHLDKGDDWRHVLPGADRPWKGHFRMPPINRDGTLASGLNTSVVVWESSIVATSRVNNAVVPIVGPPMLEHHLNQIEVSRHDGSTDLWVSGAWTPSTIDVCYRVEWKLKNFHGRDVKVVFVTAAPNASSDLSARSTAIIKTVKSPEALDRVAPTARPTRHLRPAGAPPRGRSSSSASSLNHGHDSVVDHLGGGLPHDHVFDELRTMISSTSLANPDPSSSTSVQPRCCKSRPIMTAAELVAHEGNRPGIPSMRPVVPPYANHDVDKPRPAPHYPPTVSDSTLRRLEDGIKGFVRYMDDPRAPLFRGVRSSRDQEVHVGEFTFTFARDDNGQGAWVLEVLVHLKGCWTLIRPEVERAQEIGHPFDPLKSFAFCLPGGTLDPRDEHTVECSSSPSRTARASRLARWHSPDQWTFVSRSGSAAGDLHTSMAPHSECHRVLATKWHLRAGVRANKADSHAQAPPVHVTFALDEPFEVRSRSRKEGRHAEVFSPGHARRTARRGDEGRGREGRAFE